MSSASDVSLPFQISTEADLTVVSWHDTVLTYRGVEEARAQLASIRATRLVMWDLSTVTEATVSFAQIQSSVNQAKRRGTKRPLGSKTAVVATTNVIFGIARQAEAVSSIKESPVAVSIFRDRTEALEWLRRPVKEAAG